MAIFHLNVKTVSRGSGGSASGSQEYQDREGKHAKDKAEVLAKDSGNMPDWAKSQPSEYWWAADVYERANARLCKRVEFALPRELGPETQKQLVSEFAKKLTDTTDGPLPYSYAIHRGHGQGNPHCHLMISERVNDGQTRSREDWFKRANPVNPAKGGARKTEALKPKEWLMETRSIWQNQANRALEQAGHKARIDHRTLEAQGIDRAPGKHRGVALNAMLNKGKLEPREVEKDIQPGKMDKEAEIWQNLFNALQLKGKIENGMIDVNRWFGDKKAMLEKEAHRKMELEKLQKEKTEQERQQRSRRSMGMSR